MSLFSFLFKQKSKSASTAKERLQIVIAHEHNERSAPDYLHALHQELIAVISKYTKVNPDDIRISRERQGGVDIIDVNVVISSEVAN